MKTETEKLLDQLAEELTAEVLEDILAGRGPFDAA